MLQQYPKLGEWGWAVNVMPYELPVGLADRSRVKVIEIRDSNDYVVEDEQGRRWDLTRIHLDGGIIYYLDGKPYYESHPVAVHYLRHYLLELEDRIARRDGYSIYEMQENRDDMRWHLARHGIDPDGPMPPGPPPAFTGAPRRGPSSNPRAPQSFRPETEEPVRRMNS
ncbi:hypothetical protein JIN84_17880 [Luteolibacter yonseiensis]|uniref:Uncharacterized protein n=1 Tax=Luteolibacter yonseiensis TaxID=1144680 RepID=A0A934R953_9BACT|nr:hypothetical protein [Luteolibacter yonseiensis]MBK1817495.1 hypothetical protein [Luteolibacter yonseiensis]